MRTCLWNRIVQS